jgi:hypothetical protein
LADKVRSGKKSKPDKNLEQQRCEAAQEYFGGKPWHNGDRAEKYVADLTLTQILEGWKRGKIPALVAEKYQAQIGKFFALHLEIICPYASECFLPISFCNGSDLYDRHGNAHCIEFCRNIIVTMRRRLRDPCDKTNAKEAIDVEERFQYPFCGNGRC